MRKSNLIIQNKRAKSILNFDFDRQAEEIEIRNGSMQKRK